MPSAPRLSLVAKAYVGLVIGIGFAIVGASLYQMVTRPIGYQWLLLIGLTLVSGSATVRIPSVSASISVSETFVFAAVLLYGPAAGAVTVALDGLVISFWMAKRRKEIYRALFNMAAPAMSAWLSAQLFFLLAGTGPLTLAPGNSVNPADLLGSILPALLAFAVAYFVLNSALIAFAISLENGSSPVEVWREHFIWLSLNYFCGAAIASLLVTYTRGLDLRFFGVTVPLLLLLYLTFRVSMGRVEDANRHVEKVDKMYMATIEAFAMAIDAKDQVTHDHIRRVQRYAIGLAKELGVKDPGVLKAIEAAALLHDMGKLAIPEHILNKPGRLTEAEFEKMKEHAGIGADILSSVDFPYPVVPIVRHHHESWDGSGYPTGLRGPDIPIGARILSVVDCFDALTSDRPYRRALPPAEAMEIVKRRAGSMYDPVVVETFDRIQSSLEHTRPVVVSSKHGTENIPSDSGKELLITEPLSNPEVTGESIRRLVFRVVDASVVDQIGALMPSATVVWFEVDRRADQVVARAVKGDESGQLLGIRVTCGQGLSGWVASHRLAMFNADAQLDLSSIPALSSRKELRRCTCIPTGDGEDSAGVVSVYSRTELTVDDLRLLSLIAADAKESRRVRGAR